MSLWIVKVRFIASQAYICVRRGDIWFRTNLFCQVLLDNLIGQLLQHYTSVAERTPEELLDFKARVAGKRDNHVI